MTVPIPDWMLQAESSWGDEEDTPAATTHTLYKDDPDGPITIFYEDKPHIYYRFSESGERIDIDNVTTVLKDVGPSKPLMIWAVNLALATMRSGLLNEDGSYKLLPTEELALLFDDAKTKHDQELEEAGNIGHIVHALLEAAVKKAIAETDGIMQPLEQEPEDERAKNGFKAAYAWSVAHKVKFLFAERKVFSKEYSVVGTCDGLARVSSCDDPACCKEHYQDRLAVLDWKTSKSFRTTYLLQVGIYAFAYVEETGERVTDRWVIKMDKSTGKLMTVHRGPETFELELEAFLAVLDFYRKFKLVEASMSEQNSAQRAIKKAIRDEAKAIQEAQERAEMAVAKSARMAATKERNEAKDALYKSLRSQGMNPVDAKAEVAIKFPPRPKAEKDSDDEEALVTVEPKPIIEEKPFEIEWVLNL